LFCHQPYRHSRQPCADLNRVAAWVVVSTGNTI
jgi:hypothetical protein